MIKRAYPSGLKYLCYTKREPYAYKGSGLRWENHIRYHKPHIITCVIGEYETMDELRADGLKYSQELNVVKSDDWANLRPEDGMGGGSGKVGRRWKIKDTSNMGGPKTFTEKKRQGYVRVSGSNNYQSTGVLITPWGKFTTIRDAMKTAKQLRLEDATKFVISDALTLRRYCFQSQIPLSCTPRIPKERQGKTPNELGFGFIPNEKSDD